MESRIRVLFATARQWVARLADAHHARRLQGELVALAGTRCWSSTKSAIPFEPEAANLFFQLVSSRSELASLIVTTNKPFGRRGEVFGDDIVAAAMIDRLVHHTEVVALEGDSCRLKDRDLGRPRAGSVPTSPPRVVPARVVPVVRAVRDSFFSGICAGAYWSAECRQHVERVRHTVDA